MQTILVVVHLFLAIGLIGLILIQHGKGADAGAAFGSGASSTVFGARGASSFLSRATALLATLFFVTSMVMGYFAMQAAGQKGLMETMSTQEVEAPPPVTEIPLTGDEVPAESEASAMPEVPATPEIPVAPGEPGGSEVPAVPQQ